MEKFYTPMQLLFELKEPQRSFSASSFPLVVGTTESLNHVVSTAHARAVWWWCGGDGTRATKNIGWGGARPAAAGVFYFTESLASSHLTLLSRGLARCWGCLEKCFLTFFLESHNSGPTWDKKHDGGERKRKETSKDVLLYRNNRALALHTCER